MLHESSQRCGRLIFPIGKFKTSRQLRLQRYGGAGDTEEGKFVVRRHNNNNINNNNNKN